MNQTHTPGPVGPWRIRQGWDDRGGRYVSLENDKGEEWIGEYGLNEESAAKVAAYANSYEKHFANAVEAAESDKLGQLIEALRRVTEQSQQFVDAGTDDGWVLDTPELDVARTLLAEVNR